MVLNRWEWTWSTEWGRDSMLAEAIDAQAEYAAARNRELHSQLRNLKGDLSSRLDILTAAFADYVELDGLREQLAAFPDHTRARRLAGASMTMLMNGEQPEPHADVAGYWLVPAVAAIHPDGSIDPEPAQRAISRDPEIAPRFLLTMRAVLGAGPQSLTELTELMRPVERDGVATWDEVQAIWWAAVLRGVFGPDALSSLRQVATGALTTLTAEEWTAWTIDRKRAEAPTLAGGPASRTEALEWLGDRLREATEPVDGGSDDRSWRMSWQEPPNTTTEERSKVVDPEVARRSNQGMLLTLANYLIQLGSAEEQPLLHRTAQLRRKLTTPGMGSATTDEDDSAVFGLPSRPVGVADQIRMTATDPNASLRDRRTLWAWLAPNLRTWVAPLIDEEPPAETVLPAKPYAGLMVGAAGVTDQQAFDRANAEIVNRFAPSGLALRWRPLLVSGLAVLAIGLVLLLTGNPVGALPLALGVLIAALGGKAGSGSAASRLALEEAVDRLNRRVQDVQASALRADNRARSEQADRVRAAGRLLNLLPD